MRIHGAKVEVIKAESGKVIAVTVSRTYALLYDAKGAYSVEIDKRNKDWPIVEAVLYDENH